jgi:hypothetical protein
MKGLVAGLRDGADWPKVGEELDVPDDEGAALCANGMADPVATDDTEKATAPEGEKRTRRKSAEGDG